MFMSISLRLNLYFAVLRELLMSIFDKLAGIEEEYYKEFAKKYAAPGFISVISLFM